MILIGLVCTAFLMMLLVAERGSDSTSTPHHLAIGKPAPELDLVELGDTTAVHHPEFQFENRVTLIHFWGTWCPPCRAEYPHLAELTNKLTPLEPFQFIPISCEGGSRETFESLWEKTSAFFEKQSIKSPAYADPRGVTRTSLADRLGQSNLYFPTSVLIGPDGKIAGVWEGYTESGIHEIAALVGKLIPEAQGITAQKIAAPVIEDPAIAALVI